MTMVQESIKSLRDVAETLTAGNIQTSPDLEAIYWFPADDRVHLVMLDPIAIPSEEMVPFYFNSFPEGGVTYPYAVVVIRPEEKAHLAPPPGWGSWLEAVQLWPRK